MNEQNRNNSIRDPWDQDFYETGRTRPPKNYGCLIAALLGLAIFMGGIISALGLLNIHIFTQSRNAEDPDVSSVQFLAEDPSQEATAAPTQASEATTEPAEATQACDPMQLNQSPPSIENIPQEGGLSLQEIYAKAIPSVVSISCTLQNGTSTGTGVILSQDGYIITNSHVVEDAVAIQIQLTDERVFDAQLIGADTISDLAVLSVDATGLIPAEFGDSAVLRVGDAVAAIGDPLGVQLRGSMTDGIVSAINRDITTGGRTMTVIQTNAALNSGNSGGPLLNCYGQVIGINTMKIGDYMNSNGVEGLGFAIPTTTVQEIVNQLIGQGYVSGRPSLGITGESVPYAYQRFYNMPAGLYITGVEEDSAADEMGIEPGDILVSIDKVNITDGDTLNTALYAYQAGDTVELIVFRSGRYYSLELTLNEATG